MKQTVYLFAFTENRLRFHWVIRVIRLVSRDWIKNLTRQHQFTTALSWTVKWTNLFWKWFRTVRSPNSSFKRIIREQDVTIWSLGSLTVTTRRLLDGGNQQLICRSLFSYTHFTLLLRFFPSFLLFHPVHRQQQLRKPPSSLRSYHSTTKQLYSLCHIPPFLIPSPLLSLVFCQHFPFNFSARISSSSPLYPPTPHSTFSFPSLPAVSLHSLPPSLSQVICCFDLSVVLLRLSLNTPPPPSPLPWQWRERERNP